MNSAANDLPVALCVEDDSDLAYLLQFILEREGYAVAVACDGDSAQKWIAAAAAPPALVMLDVMLPQADGFHVLNRIRENSTGRTSVSTAILDEPIGPPIPQARDSSKGDIMASKFFQGFLHFNIRCSEEDLPAIEKFYGDVLDLKSGARPNFMAPGMWLYYGDDPILHVGARFDKGAQIKDHHSGSLDHIAWKATGAVDFRKRLKALNIEFEEQNIKDAGYQVFLYDPVGTKLEFNFEKEHVPDAVPLGTTAGANLR